MPRRATVFTDRLGAGSAIDEPHAGAAGDLKPPTLHGGPLPGPVSRTRAQWFRSLCNPLTGVPRPRSFEEMADAVQHGLRVGDQVVKVQTDNRARAHRRECGEPSLHHRGPQCSESPYGFVMSV